MANDLLKPHAGIAQMKIVIDASVNFTLGNGHRVEVHGIDASAHLESGATFGFDPPLTIDDVGCVKLQHVILDAILAYVSKMQRNNLTAIGAAPIVEIIAATPPKGQVH